MKTFNESDLITWSNREKAEVGKEYYFADSLIGMKSCINNNYGIYTLSYIAEDAICKPFNCLALEGKFSYACLLPIDAVKEQEKKYRACKTLKEFYEVVNNYGSDSFPNEDFTDENLMYNLLDSTFHTRTISTHTEYYFSIRCIKKYEKDGIEILMTLNKSYLSFEEIFENYEIELNGIWLPFGVLDEN